jgi:hypothetical protein
VNSPEWLTCEIRGVNTAGIPICPGILNNRSLPGFQLSGARDYEYLAWLAATPVWCGAWRSRSGPVVERPNESLAAVADELAVTVRGASVGRRPEPVGAAECQVRPSRVLLLSQVATVWNACLGS